MRNFLVLAAVLTAAPVLAQSPAGTTTTSTSVAYVYVGTSNGVYLYHAASSGQLTPVTGSPFQIPGMAAAATGKYFFNVDTNLVHVYPVAANGAIEPQVSQIDTTSYSGSNCEPASPPQTVLDHTGEDLYVLLSNGEADNACTSYQSYTINKTTGMLTYAGAATQSVWVGLQNYPTITPDDQYLYIATEWNGNNEINAFRRTGNGSLALWDFTETDPPEQNGLAWLPFLVASDPTGHLAVVLAQYGQPDIRIASYTVDTQGNIATTNTIANMPVTDVFPTDVRMSPGGKYLAVVGNVSTQAFHGTTGLEIYHFNGADPPTKYKVVTTSPIDEVRWDKSNHLYAISSETNQLRVYSVTSTGIHQEPGSPYALPAAPHALVVVPK